MFSFLDNLSILLWIYIIFKCKYNSKQILNSHLPFRYMV